MHAAPPMALPLPDADVRRARLAMLLLVGAAFGAGAAPTADQAAGRAAIRTERAAVEARYQAGVQQCRDQFVVASCLDEQKAQRRHALAELRQRELALDEAVRKAEADEAARRVEAKQAELDRRTPRPQAHAPAASTPLSARQAPTSAASQAEARARRNARAAEEAAAAATRAQAQQRRASEAEARREAAERRNAERAAKGKPPAAPLPVPPAASGPTP